MVVYRIAALGFALAGATSFAAELRPATVEAFHQYVQSAGVSARRPPQGWAAAGEKSPPNRLLIYRSHAPQEVAGGLIHDWTGAVLAPLARVEEVAALLRDFDRHHEFYSEIIASAGRGGDEELARGWWRVRKKKGLTVILDIEIEARSQRLDVGRWFIASRSTSVREVRKAGRTMEQARAPGRGRGFLWALNAYWWLEQAGRGVWVQCRTISLTRRAPAILGWLVTPFLESAPRESLETMLHDTRSAFSNPGGRPRFTVSLPPVR